jgi:hypothetical protein
LVYTAGRYLDDRLLRRRHYEVEFTKTLIQIHIAVCTRAASYAKAFISASWSAC